MIKQFNLLAATHLSLSYSSFMRPGIQNKKADSFFLIQNISGNTGFWFF